MEKSTLLMAGNVGTVMNSKVRLNKDTLNLRKKFIYQHPVLMFQEPLLNEK